MQFTHFDVKARVVISKLKLLLKVTVAQFLFLCFSLLVVKFVVRLFSNGSYIASDVLHYFTMYWSSDLFVCELHSAGLDCRSIVTLNRAAVTVACVDSTKQLIIFWASQGYLYMEAPAIKELLVNAVVVIKDTVLLLDFPNWIRFWFYPASPLMPWGWLHGKTGLYGVEYRTSVRIAFLTCIRAVLFGYALNTEEKSQAILTLAKILGRLWGIRAGDIII